MQQQRMAGGGRGSVGAFHGAQAGPGQVGYLGSDSNGVERSLVGDEAATGRLGQADEGGSQQALVLGIDVGADERGDRLGHGLLDPPDGVGELLVAARATAEQ